MVYAIPLEVDVTGLTYTQAPACGYTYSSVYTWNNLPASVSEAPANSGKLIVSTSNLAHVATTAINFVNVITIVANGPASNTVFSVNTAPDQVAFNIVVTDPCTGTSASPVVFHDGSANVITAGTVVNGQSLDITIKAPWSAFATSEGVLDRCGAMGAAVYTTGAAGPDTNPTNNWASVTGPDFATGDFTLKINTALAMTLIGANAESDQTLYIKTHLADYTSVE